METENTDFDEVSFVEVELLNENPEDTLDDFRYRFYKHRQHAKWMRYAGLLLAICGVGAMLWFICVPAAIEHQNSWRFYHSAQFFFLLCWGMIASLIFVYFVFSGSADKRSYRHLLDRAEQLTYEMRPPAETTSTMPTPPSTDSAHG